MKKIVSLLLGIFLIAQPMQAMQTPSEPSAEDAVYALLKGGAQGIYSAVKGVGSVVGQIGSAVYNLGGRTMEDSGISKQAGDLAQTSTTTVVGATKAAQNSVGAAATAIVTAGTRALKVGAIATGAAAMTYGVYWLNTQPTRNALKAIKEKLAPEIPTVEAGLGTKSKYRIFNWKLTKYPTAGKLNEIKDNEAQFTTFLNDLASDIINNEFRGINRDLCLTAGGDRITDRRGVQLTQEAARQILIHIEREKPMLQLVLDALRGKDDLSLAHLEATLNATMDIHEAGNTVAVPCNYIAFGGWEWPKRLVGAKGGLFSFDYAKEYKDACQAAGLDRDAIVKPSEMTPAQYQALDKHMNDVAKINLNKFIFMRFHYAQAARLYWSTYKKLHRIEALENMLNAKMHHLPVTNRPAGQIIYIR